MSVPIQCALVVELWGLGDGILATPILQSLREREIAVTLLCKSNTADILRKSYPHVKFSILDAPWTSFRGKYLLWRWPWRKLIAAIRTLRRERFDLAFSVRSDPRDHFLMWLVGARRRAGFPRAGSRPLLSDPVESSPNDEHIVHRWWRLEEMAFGSSLKRFPHVEPEFPSAPRERRLSVQTLCIHCGAKIPVRRWPEAHFAEVLRRVRADFDCRIVLIPDPDGYGRALADQADLVREQLDFSGLISELSTASAVLANDSGPAHLADALGTPVAAIFGPQTPAKFRPFSERSIVLVRDICPYRPCSDSCHFAEPTCLTRLTVDLIWPEFRDFLLKNGFFLRSGSAQGPDPQPPPDF
jgi:heptosyltransferase-2